MDTYTASEDDEDTTWIQWYCAMKGNEFFCECDEDYIQDDFNLHGLNSWVPYYESALDMILDMESPGDQALSEEQQVKVEGAAEMLYGLIHARYILTSRGMHNMVRIAKQTVHRFMARQRIGHTRPQLQMHWSTAAAVMYWLMVCCSWPSTKMSTLAAARTSSARGNRYFLWVCQMWSAPARSRSGALGVRMSTSPSLLAWMALTLGPPLRTCS